MIAYRKIAKKGMNAHKCHIDFAVEVFEEINRRNTDEDLCVIVSDITGFFDNLDHKVLKRQWCKTLGTINLPADHYNVYKAATNFSYVDEPALFNLFKNRIITQRTPNAKIRIRPIGRLSYLRDKHAIAFCRHEDICEIRRNGIIRTTPFVANDKGIRSGIPQGLPISATLANIYMREFDIKVHQLVEKYNGLYRRYSDDILIIVPAEHVNQVKESIFQMIQDCVKLEIQEQKTKIVRFNKSKNHEFEQLQQLEYLGLSFDGQRILIKNKSLNGYYNRMRKDIFRKRGWALRKRPFKIFENQFIRRFTLAGSKRFHKQIVKAIDGEKRNHIKSDKKSFGNYLTYALRVADISGSKEVMHQLSRNLCIASKLLNEAKLYLKNKIVE